MDELDNSKQPKFKKSTKINKEISKLLTEKLLKTKCEKLALSIVIELIDGELEESVLLQKLRSINVCHYDDIIEERYILKRCGYVLCNEQLISIPTQQYKISSVKKKVYDITERKKFCSNICYKSSKYLQSQLLTSPLWLRDTESIPKFKLLKKPKSNTYSDLINFDSLNLNDIEEM